MRGRFRSCAVEVWLCGRSLPEIADSNSAGDMDICLLWRLCVVQVEVSGMGRSLAHGSPTECVRMRVTKCDQVQQSSPPPHLKWVGRQGSKLQHSNSYVCYFGRRKPERLYHGCFFVIYFYILRIASPDFLGALRHEQWEFGFKSNRKR
jgi:hypothetical protein